MFSLVRTLLNTSKLISTTKAPVLAAQFHSVVAHKLKNNATIRRFLSPNTTTSLIPNCGFKVMGRVRRRCKDCYLVWRENRLYNICKTHPRHKQMSMVKDPKNTWILTHATQSKVRPW